MKKNLQIKKLNDRQKLETPKQKKINVHTTAVGDRHILKALGDNNWSLGGEQSGHIIFSDQARTGDGILTGLHLLDCMKRSQIRLAELAQSSMRRFPQVLHSIELKEQLGDQNTILQQAQPLITAAESFLRSSLQELNPLDY